MPPKVPSGWPSKSLGRLQLTTSQGGVPTSQQGEGGWWLLAAERELRLSGCGHCAQEKKIEALEDKEEELEERWAAFARAHCLGPLYPQRSLPPCGRVEEAKRTHGRHVKLMRKADADMQQ